MRQWASERVEWQDPTPLTKHNIEDFKRVLDRHVKQICDQMQAASFKAALGLNREGINYMTTKTNETATLDTPEGTLLVLVDDSSVLAEAGALAIVDSEVRQHTDTSRFLNVRWIKGHTRDGMSQMNGGYDPETFQIHEFQVGDRVRVRDDMPFENGYEGVITEIPADNGDDCRVAVDSPYTKAAPMSYRFDSLEKQDYASSTKRLRDLLNEAWNAKDPFEADEPRGYIEEDEADDEPAFEVGQRVTVKYGSEMWDGPGTVTRISGPYVIVKPDNFASEGGFAFREVEPLDETVEVGGVVVIDTHGLRTDLGEWEGRRFRVERNDGESYFLSEIDQRPDRFVGSNFVWEKSYTRPFDPEHDLRVGDIVRGDNLLPAGSGLPAQGVVTRLEGDFAGDFEVNWQVGLEALVESGPLGYTRSHAVLVGTDSKAIPQFKAGDTITVTSNTDSGHFLRIGSKAEVVGVNVLVRNNEPDIEYTVMGEEEHDGTPLRQFLLAQDVGEYVPEPEVEDFAFEAGQEIGSSEVLGDLPIGSVLVIDGDEVSPVVKTGDSFSRVNRFSTRKEGRLQPQAYFEDDRVREAADGGGTLVLTHVPAVA